MGWQGPGHSDRLWCETWGTSFTGPWASDGCEGCRGTVWLLDSPPPPSSDGCPARLLVDCPARGPGCHEGLHGSGLVQSAVALAESLGWGAAAPLLQLSLLPSQDGDRACPSRWPCLGPRGYQSCGGCWRCLQCMEWVVSASSQSSPRMETSHAPAEQGGPAPCCGQRLPRSLGHTVNHLLAEGLHRLTSWQRQAHGSGQLRAERG